MGSAKSPSLLETITKPVGEHPNDTLSWEITIFLRRHQVTNGKISVVFGWYGYFSYLVPYYVCWNIWVKLVTWPFLHFMNAQVYKTCATLSYPLHFPQARRPQNMGALADVGTPHLPQKTVTASWSQGPPPSSKCGFCARLVGPRSLAESDPWKFGGSLAMRFFFFRGRFLPKIPFQINFWKPRRCVMMLLLWLLLVKHSWWPLEHWVVKMDFSVPLFKACLKQRALPSCQGVQFVPQKGCEEKLLLHWHRHHPETARQHWFCHWYTLEFGSC